MSDINIAVVDSLKVLDPNRPIREADMGVNCSMLRHETGFRALSTCPFVPCVTGLLRYETITSHATASPVCSDHLAKSPRGNSAKAKSRPQQCRRSDRLGVAQTHGL